jgi:cobyrinic acid a,c-diamide synthase
MLERDASLAIAERHLGLMPSNETMEAEALVERIADLVAGQVDLNRLLGLAAGVRADDSVESVRGAQRGRPRAHRSRPRRGLWILLSG